MNLVEPIRDPNLLKEIARWLKQENERDYMFFITGTCTALRVSDLLTIKTKESRQLSIRIRERKTRKSKILPISPMLKRELDSYAQGKPPGEYLFKSRQGYNQPISRQTAYRIMQKISVQFGIPNLGCHSLRKTFGYHFYLQTKDIYTLMQILNHSDPAITLDYIGVTQDEMADAVKRFRIF